ncbi:hypothetical protein ABPG72_002326 [Tetrahymena utriculariae]
MLEEICTLIQKIEILRATAYEELEIPHLIEKIENSSIYKDQVNLFNSVVYIREFQDENYITYATNLFNKFQYAMMKLQVIYEYLTKLDFKIHSTQKSVISNCLDVLRKYFSEQKEESQKNIF